MFPPWIALHPSLDHIEHVSVYFDVAFSGCRVMKYLQAIIQHLLRGDVWVVPGVKHARSDKFEDLCSDLASWFVQDIAEMILTQHGVCWVGAVGIRPRLILMSTTRVHNRTAACL